MNLPGRVLEGITKKQTIAELQSQIVEIQDNYNLLEADTELLKTKIEEIGWEKVSIAETEEDIGHDDRVLINKRILRLWRKNPFVGHAVNLSNWFVFGQGVSIPKVDDLQGQDIINSIWTDKYNRKSIFSPVAQWTRHTVLQLTGELFLVFFVSKKDGDFQLSIRTLHPNLISDIITHPDDKDINIAFKRDMSSRKYNYDNGLWEEGSPLAVTKYHLDWAIDKESELFKDNLPIEEKILDGRIYHIKMNTIGKRGWSELYRVGNWVDSFNTLAAAMVSHARAEAMFAWERKTKRGRADIASAKERFSPSGGSSQVPPAVASILYGTEGVDWKQFSRSGTTASAFAENLRQLRLIFATGVSIPEHYLADGSQGNMATAKTMEIWALKKYLALQKMWEEVYTDIVKYALCEAGIEKEIKVDIDFPPITVEEVKAWVESVILSNKEGKISDQLSSTLILQVLGVNNISDEIKKMYREGEKESSARDVLMNLTKQVEDVIKEEGGEK